MDFPYYPPKRSKDKRSGKLRLAKYESKSKSRGIRSKPVRRTKTSTITFRIDEQLKEWLKTNAARQGQTLTSLLVRVLQGFFESYESGLPIGGIQRERRNHVRRKVILPARWKFRRSKDQAEHDVLVRNICAGGAYTEYINGKNLSFLEDLRSSTFSLVVRMPGSQKALELESEVRRIQITEESVNVALRFIDTLNEESLKG